MNHYTIKFFSEIQLGSVIIRDPVTALTNILIFLAGYWCWRQIRNSEDASVKAWSKFFLFIGTSSLVGVLVHGFSYYFSLQTHFWIWITMSLIQNLAVSFAQTGTALRYFPKQKNWILVLIVLQFMGAAAGQIASADYKWAKWHIALGLLPVMGLYFARWANGEKKSKWIALGIAVSGITVAVHSFKISISKEWFNFNDIAHLLIVASLLIMIKGFAAGRNEEL